MTKAIITCNLHKREGKPSVNAKSLGHYVSGEEVEIVEVVLGSTESDYYEGTPTWYQLSNGLYVWSGGVSLNLDDPIFLNKLELDKSVSQADQNPDEHLVNLPDVVVLKADLPKIPGTEKVVAVLDSGIDQRFPDLASRVLNSHSKNFQSETGFQSHGTQVAGLMVANDKDLFGIAPEVSLMDLRVVDAGGSTNDDAVKQALAEIYDLNSAEDDFFCDIINLSLDVSEDKIPFLQPVVDKLFDQGVIILVAGNQFGFLNNVATLERVFPIGVFESYEYADLIASGLPAELIVSYYNQTIKTTSDYPSHRPFGDSSAYTSFTSGLVARFLSTHDIEPKNRPSSVLTYLKDISFSIQQENPSNKPIPYKPYRNE